MATAAELAEQEREAKLARAQRRLDESEAGAKALRQRVADEVATGAEPGARAAAYVAGRGHPAGRGRPGRGRPPASAGPGHAGVGPPRGRLADRAAQEHHLRAGPPLRRHRRAGGARARGSAWQEPTRTRCTPRRPRRLRRPSRPSMTRRFSSRWSRSTASRTASRTAAGRRGERPEAEPPDERCQGRRGSRGVPTTEPADRRPPNGATRPARPTQPTRPTRSRPAAPTKGSSRRPRLPRVTTTSLRWSNANPTKAPSTTRRVTASTTTTGAATSPRAARRRAARPWLPR